MIWKQDWDQTRENHRKFWKGEGTVIVPCSKALRSRKKPREDVGEWASREALRTACRLGMSEEAKAAR